MKRCLALVLMALMILMAMAPMAMACEERGGDWQTGDLLKVTNCNSWVSLRRTASTKAQRLEKVPKLAEVYFLSYAADGFCHVYYNGEYGYILEEYLAYDGNSVRFVTGCNEWISLRTEPSTKSERRAKIPLNSLVYYTNLERNDQFAWVNYGNTAGYALEEYLSLTPFERGDRATVANCDQYITLRWNPSVNAGSRAKVPLGAKVVVAEEAGNGFVRVQYNGMDGYVLAGYLQV